MAVAFGDSFREVRYGRGCGLPFEIISILFKMDFLVQMSGTELIIFVNCKKAGVLFYSFGTGFLGIVHCVFYTL
ncbi:MAG: hypothetical protein JST68_09765 [Bacteroidetes bacterium]|nr:hypothetical protein [Bacteroidota bacterium]